MWDLVLDVLAVRADETGERDVLVVDLQLVALPEQGLCQDDDRALAQIIGAGLEAEAEQPDALVAALHDQVDGVLDLQAVAAEDRFDDRHVDVYLLRTILQGPHVLRQARAAER